LAASIAGFDVAPVPLHDSSNSVILRGSDGGKPVVLKMLKEEYPSPERTARFHREFELTRDLGLATAVQARALLTDRNRLVMVLEDFGGTSLDRLQIAGTLSMGEFLDLAVRLAGALADIHAKGVVHKDINPSNIVSNPDTGAVKLIDFGISSQLASENQSLRTPASLEGTLAYISPEQTGRMNRALDQRADLYSLGVSLYELLTGRLPFDDDDPLALVHAHIARQPAPASEVRDDVPEVVAAIIDRLLQKNAEDRYQTARGLQIDLQRCLAQHADGGPIRTFELGDHDASDRLQLSEKLYGREVEIQALVDAFERASDGNAELMMVAGRAGIGKSALVREVYKPLTQRRGYFVAGKFDQYQRNIPYASLIQCLRSLVMQLLTESESSLARWRELLADELRANARVVVDVIPELELIVGETLPVPRLDPTEAQNRYMLTMRRFIGVFGRADHPW